MITRLCKKLMFKINRSNKNVYNKSKYHSVTYICRVLLIIVVLKFDFLIADDKDKLLCTPFMKSKTKIPDSSQAYAADLSTIEGHIKSGFFTSVAQFDADVCTVFSNAMREHGRMSALGSAAVQLKKVKNIF